MILIQLLLTSMASHGTQDGLSGSVKRGFDELWVLENKEPGALAYYEDWVSKKISNLTDGAFECEIKIKFPKYLVTLLWS